MFIYEKNLCKKNFFVIKREHHCAVASKSDAWVPSGQSSWLVSSNWAKMLQNFLALHQITKRTISTASGRQFENKVPKKQKLFQEDNGIPVYLKSGIADALLYRATMVLIAGGMAYAIYKLAVASFPKKQDWLQFILPAMSWFNSIQLSVGQ